MDHWVPPGSGRLEPSGIAPKRAKRQSWLNDSRERAGSVGVATARAAAPMEKRVRPSNDNLLIIPCFLIRGYLCPLVRRKRALSHRSPITDQGAERHLRLHSTAKPSSQMVNGSPPQESKPMLMASMRSSWTWPVAVRCQDASPSSGMLTGIQSQRASLKGGSLSRFASLAGLNSICPFGPAGGPPAPRFDSRARSGSRR